MNPLMDLRSTLFVGNLSVFCTERELEQVFAPYGSIVEIRMAKSEDQSKHLSYGFVRFLNVASAQLAMHELNGQILCGRPLKIGKALSRTNKKGNEPPEPHQDYTTASVHVTFISHQIVRIVTEESLRYLFGRFGPVVDAVICKSNIDRRQGRQSGYGFIHYPGSQQGVEASFIAADTLMDVMIDEVNYKCKISHHLEQRLHPPGSGPVSSVASPASGMIMMQPGGPSALAPHNTRAMGQQAKEMSQLALAANTYGLSQQQHGQQLAPSLPLYQRYGMNSPQVGPMSTTVGQYHAAPPLPTNSNATSPYGYLPAHHAHHQSPINHQLQQQQPYSEQQNYGAYGMTLPLRAPPSASFSNSNDAYQAAMDSYRGGGLYVAEIPSLGIPAVSREDDRIIKQQQQMYQIQQQQQQQLAPFAQPEPSPISTQSFYNSLSPPGYYPSNNNNHSSYSSNNRPPVVVAAAEMPLPAREQQQYHQGHGQVSGLFDQAIIQQSSASSSSKSQSVEFSSSNSDKMIVSMPSIGSTHSRSTEIMGAFEAMSLSASSGASTSASYASTENISQYPSLMLTRGPNTPNTSTHRMAPSSYARKYAIDALYGNNNSSASMVGGISTQQQQTMNARDGNMCRFDSSASMSQENAVTVKDVDEDLFTNNTAVPVDADIDDSNNNDGNN